RSSSAALVWLSILLCASDRVHGNQDKGEATVRGKTAAEWIEILRSDKQPSRRRAALIALNAFGPKSSFVIPAVAESLRKDASEDVRAAAAQLLGSFVPLASQEKLEIRDGIEALTEALRTDKADRVRQTAAVSLGKVGAEARAAVASLAGALKAKHPGTSAAAAESLAALGHAAR